MATAQHIETAHDGPGFRLHRWMLTADETGEPVIVAGFARATVYLAGDFGRGAVRIEIAPDPEGSVWFTATDADGTALSHLTSARVETVREHGYLLRPVTGPGLERVTLWAGLTT